MEIKLQRGMVTLVDDQDGDLAKIKWYAHRHGNINLSRWYVSHSCATINGKQPRIHLHRLILERMLGRSLASNEQVDHINHDCLDNQRSNLRLATNQENMRNRRANTKPQSSRYKGVYWHKCTSKWQARIGINGRRVFIGLYDNEEDAARAYDKKAKATYGDFCCLNNLTRGDEKQ